MIVYTILKKIIQGKYNCKLLGINYSRTESFQMIVSRRLSRKSQIVRITKRNEVRLHIISILIKIRFIDGEVSKFNVYVMCGDKRPSN